MGTSYQSLHLRTDDAEAVADAARLVARQDGVKMFVAPPKAGWVAVYSSQDDWHPGQSEAIAKACKGKVEHALAFSLHDSDVLAYWYYRGGVLRDRFLSCPDYFGKAEEGDLEAVGDAEQFAELLPEAEKRRALAKLIAGRLINGEFVGECPDFEDERLETLAGLFGMVGAMASYEMLLEGETVPGVGGARAMTRVG